jgi:hypothetical protein
MFFYLNQNNNLIANNKRFLLESLENSVYGSIKFKVTTIERCKNIWI